MSFILLSFKARMRFRLQGGIINSLLTLLVCCLCSIVPFIYFIKGFFRFQDIGSMCFEYNI
jgi:hypothetical protein